LEHEILDKEQKLEEGRKKQSKENQRQREAEDQLAKEESFKILQDAAAKAIDEPLVEFSQKKRQRPDAPQGFIASAKHMVMDSRRMLVGASKRPRINTTNSNSPLVRVSSPRKSSQSEVYT